MGIPRNCGRVVKLGSNDALGGNIIRKLLTDIAYHFEQILEVFSHNTEVLRSLARHLINHTRKTNEKCWILWWSMDNFQSNVVLLESYTWKYQCEPTCKDVHYPSFCGHWFPTIGSVNSHTRQRLMVRVWVCVCKRRGEKGRAKVIIAIF